MKRIVLCTYFGFTAAILFAQPKGINRFLADQWTFEKPGAPAFNSIRKGLGVSGKLLEDRGVSYADGLAYISNADGALSFNMPVLVKDPFTVWTRLKLAVDTTGTISEKDTTVFMNAGGVRLSCFFRRDEKKGLLWGISGDASGRIVPGNKATIETGAWVQIALVKKMYQNRGRIKVYYRVEKPTAALINWTYLGTAEIPGNTGEGRTRLLIGPAHGSDMQLSLSVDEVKAYTHALTDDTLLSVWPSLRGFEAVPESPFGVVIDHAPARTGRYVGGSPSIVVLDDGTCLAKGDDYGPAVGISELTRIYRSRDKGETWEPISEVEGSTWATLFKHKGAVYLLGTSAGHKLGHVVIMRSADNGLTWTKPVDEKTGLLRPDLSYHTAPTPVIVHNGRIWRTMEDEKGGGGWGRTFRAMIMSAPADADLLDAKNWTFSDNLGYNPNWLDGQFNGFLEGNIVAAPNGAIINLLRVSMKNGGGKAAVLTLGKNGRILFDPATDFISFPGGSTKFHVLYDSVSRRYWALSNPVLKKHLDEKADESLIRNTLVLMQSADLRNWNIVDTVLYHPDVAKHAFQYPSFVFDGNDIVLVTRTAYDDAMGGASRQHDVNYFTFYRIRNFRQFDKK